MTNEMLVARIQGGESALMPQLWDSVERWVRTLSRRYARVYQNCGVDGDDLYQSGYIAFSHAVDTFDCSRDKTFVGWFTFFLRSAFAEAAGVRTERQRNDPLNKALSLYMPVSEEDDTLLLQDIIPDPENRYKALDNKWYNDDLHNALEEVIDLVPSDKAVVIRRHYFEEQPHTEIAASLGVSVSDISKRQRDGLNSMRRQLRTSRGARLRAFAEDCTNFYLGNGYGTFKRTHSSPIENRVIFMETKEQLAARFGTALA